MICLINSQKQIKKVYKQSEDYLEQHKALQEDIAKHIRAYRDILDLLPLTFENFFRGQSFPYYESYYELESSFELSKQGFYRHSLISLRSVLELGVMQVYFDMNDQAHLDIREWLHSRCPTPHFQKCLKAIFKADSFKQFDEIYHLQDEVKILYGELSDYVHTRGFNHSQTGQIGANFNRFNEQSFVKYVEFMKRVVKSLVIMMLLKYPIGMQELPIFEKFGFNFPVGTFLWGTPQKMVLAILDENIIKVLRKLSDENPEVKDLVDYILSLPDLTPEELDRQDAECMAERVKRMKKLKKKC